MTEDREKMPPKEILDAMNAQLDAKKTEISNRIKDNVKKGFSDLSCVILELSILSMQLENLTRIVIASQIDIQNERPLIEIPRIGLHEVKKG